MPRGSWTAKDERQYKHIKVSCLAKKRNKTTRAKRECTRIAAATVNKQKSKSKSKLGSCGCSIKS